MYIYAYNCFALSLTDGMEIDCDYIATSVCFCSEYHDYYDHKIHSAGARQTNANDWELILIKYLCNSRSWMGMLFPFYANDVIYLISNTTYI